MKKNKFHVIAMLGNWDWIYKTPSGVFSQNINLAERFDTYKEATNKLTNWLSTIDTNKKMFFSRAYIITIKKI